MFAENKFPIMEHGINSVGGYDVSNNSIEQNSSNPGAGTATSPGTATKIIEPVMSDYQPQSSAQE